MKQRLPLLIITILLSSFSLFAQNYTLEGSIRDINTLEVLPFASVLVEENGKGVSSDEDGHYSLKLTAGTYTIKVSYLGYETKSQSITISKDRNKNINLSATVFTAEEVTIGGVRTDKNVQESKMSVVKLSSKTLKGIPAFMGEVDLLKTIQLMPGVQSGGEGSTGYYVRGGGPDQNLISLDGATIYNASHLFGFFSVFNADAIDNVELYKGGMPAEYGGRISSVLDIEMTEGNTEKIEGSGGIGTISSRFTLQGPIKKDTASFIFSARRTYIDVLVMPFVKEDSPIKGSGYYFYDLNGKITYRLNEKNSLFVSGYYGKDKFKLNQKESGLSLAMPWGNSMASARWNHLFNQELFSNLTLSFTDYEFSMNTEFIIDKETESTSSFAQYSGIRDASAQYDFTWLPNDQHIVKYGANYTLHTFTPNTLNSDFPGMEDIGEGVKQHAHESSVFIGDDWKINSRATLYGGLRAANFSQVGPFTRYVKDENNLNDIDSIYYDKRELVASYFSLEPRLSFKYSTGKTSSIKASYMRNKQFIHLASLSASTLPTDLWVSSTDRVKPKIAQQFAAGFFKNFNDNMYESSIEAYYKQMHNMLEYADGAMPGDEINDNVDNFFVFGEGQSYGVEFLFRKNVGRLTGWLGYTWSKTDRQFDDIDDGKRFPAKYDRTHDLSFTATYQINKRLDASLVYVYATGNTTTLPTSLYVQNGDIVYEYGSRNWYRLDPYHRMDLSLNYKLTGNKWFDSSLNFSVYNVYNRKNPFFVYFDIEGDVSDNSFAILAKQVSLFPILPSITWNFTF